MKQLKFVLIGCGVIGLISMFVLPIISMGPMSIKFWDLREAAAGRVYLTLLGFLVPAILGGMAVAKGSLVRWQAIVSALLFIVIVVLDHEVLQGEIGGKLLVISAIIGAIASIVAAVKPEQG